MSEPFFRSPSPCLSQIAETKWGHAARRPCPFSSRTQLHLSPNTLLAYTVPFYVTSRFIAMNMGHHAALDTLACDVSRRTHRRLRRRKASSIFQDSCCSCSRSSAHCLTVSTVWNSATNYIGASILAFEQPTRRIELCIRATNSARRIQRMHVHHRT